MRSQEKQLFHFKLTILIGLALLAWALFSYSKLLYQSYQLDQKKQWFETEIRTLHEQNVFRAEEFEYLQTEFFLERAAKEKLNKKKLGEKVIVLEKPKQEFAAIVSQEDRLNMKIDSLSNEQKWWYYLFGSEDLLSQNEL
jgi:hypothetical protein